MGASALRDKLSCSEAPDVNCFNMVIHICGEVGKVDFAFQMLDYMVSLQLPPNYWLRLATYNCGLTHFQIRATGSVSLFGFGDIGHLDLDQTTYH